MLEDINFGGIVYGIHDLYNDIMPIFISFTKWTYTIKHNEPRLINITNLANKY